MEASWEGAQGYNSCHFPEEANNIFVRELTALHEEGCMSPPSPENQYLGIQVLGPGSSCPPRLHWTLRGRVRELNSWPTSSTSRSKPFSRPSWSKPKQQFTAVFPGQKGGLSSWKRADTGGFFLERFRLQFRSRSRTRSCIHLFYFYYIFFCRLIRAKANFRTTYEWHTQPLFFRQWHAHTLYHTTTLFTLMFPFTSSSYYYNTPKMYA